MTNEQKKQAIKNRLARLEAKPSFTANIERKLKRQLRKLEREAVNE